MSRFLFCRLKFKPRTNIYYDINIAKTHIFQLIIWWRDLFEHSSLSGLSRLAHLRVCLWTRTWGNCSSSLTPLVYAPCLLCPSALLWNSPGSTESRKHNSTAGPARTLPLTNYGSWTNSLTLGPVSSHFTQSTWLQALCQLWFYPPRLEFSKEVLQNWLEFPRGWLGN